MHFERPSVYTTHRMLDVVQLRHDVRCQILVLVQDVRFWFKPLLQQNPGYGAM